MLVVVLVVLSEQSVLVVGRSSASRGRNRNPPRRRLRSRPSQRSSFSSSRPRFFLLSSSSSSSSNKSIAFFSFVATPPSFSARNRRLRRPDPRGLASRCARTRPPPPPPPHPPRIPPISLRPSSKPLRRPHPLPPSRLLRFVSAALPGVYPRGALSVSTRSRLFSLLSSTLCLSRVFSLSFSSSNERVFVPGFEVLEVVDRERVVVYHPWWSFCHRSSSVARRRRRRDLLLPRQSDDDGDVVVLDFEETMMMMMMMLDDPTPTHARRTRATTRFRTFPFLVVVLVVVEYNMSFFSSFDDRRCASLYRGKERGGPLSLAFGRKANLILLVPRIKLRNSRTI